MNPDSHVANLISLAAEQRGLVTSRQAKAVASVTPQQLKRLADNGVLERLHHGIYRLARVPHDEHLEMRVAWLALDPGTVTWERLRQEVPTGVLSHRSAAGLHRLGDLEADEVELTTTRRIRLSLPDVVTRRGSIVRAEWQLVDGLPVTTARRTIGDLAAQSLDSGHLASVVRDALTANMLTTDQAAAVLAPHAFGYGYRALDGEGFLAALIEEAGVPVNTLAVADIARRHAGFEELSNLGKFIAQLNDPQQAEGIRAAVSALASPQHLRELSNAVASLSDSQREQAEAAAAAFREFNSNMEHWRSAADAFRNIDPAFLEAIKRADQ